MTDKQATGNGGDSGGGKPAGQDGSTYNGIAGPRPYAAPRILSSEDLELAAAGCDLAGAKGKNWPGPCAAPGT